MSENFADDIHSDLAAGRALELAELYALNALSDQERKEIDHYLAVSETSLQTAFALRVNQTQEALVTAYGNVEEEPPSSLFERISAEILASSTAATPAQTPLRAVPDRVGTDTGSAEDTGSFQSGPLQSEPLQSNSAKTESTETESGQPANGEPAAGPTDELAARRTKRKSLRGWVIGTAAAAALVVAGAFGINGILATQNSPTNQVITASDVRVSTVPVEGGGDAKVSISAAKDSAVVQMTGVPEPQTGKVYQLWLLPEGTDKPPVSIGLMASSTDLGKPALVTGINTAQALAITVEPAGGSPKPTAVPVMFSKVNT